MCGKWVPNCALICLGSRVSFDLPLALAPGVFMTGPGCGWSKISRVRAPYDNLGPAVKPLQSPESAVYIMDSLLGGYFLLQESRAESMAWPHSTNCHAILPDIFEKLLPLLLTDRIIELLLAWLQPAVASCRAFRDPGGVRGSGRGRSGPGPHGRRRPRRR